MARVALVLLMASGAALLIRSGEKLRAIDTGVDAPGVAVIDVVPTDALSLLSAAAVLAAADLLAAWVPARRASRTDPAIVLRES